jgi:hypothetical protein
MRILRDLGLVKLAVGLLVLAMGSACSKKDDDDDDEEEATEVILAGQLLIKIDEAVATSMSSAGQDQFALTTADMVDTYCEDNGDIKDEYKGDENELRLFWLCTMSVVSNGPDTPRGAIERVKAMACAVDKASGASGLAYDGTEKDITITLDTDCFTKEFVDMVKDELGKAELDIQVTGYEDIPTSIANADEWDRALIMQFGEELDGMKYTITMKSADDVVAAQIMSEEDGEEDEVFAFSILSGDEDAATLRYEGRFPGYDKGETGSRHIRLMVTGEYTEEDGFSSFESGVGIYADIYPVGSEWCSSCTAEPGSTIRTFKAEDGTLVARSYSGNPTETISSTTVSSNSEDVGESDGLLYVHNADAKKFLMSKDLGGFTASAAWFKAASALDFKSVKIQD